ncbi:MAG: alpha/beta hydrolase [Anaerolineae bacterium]|jgi:pimeloyl-ACP methyl ester carboxylesterase|nr:alpha/beta hydrolase [Anaerolineae bacterium]
MPLITTSRGQIFIADHRKADSTHIPVIFIHGAGGTHLDWSADLRRLPQANAVALDLPAHGKSTPPHRTTIKEYADDVLALVDALQLPRAIFAGHSMGGGIAQQIAVSYPDKVAGLILFGTGAKLSVHPDILNRVMTDYAGVADLLAGWLWGADVTDEMKQITREQLLKTAPEVTFGDYTACNGFDIRAELKNITAPTLVISGTHDKMTPLKYGQYLADNIPNTQLAIIENAGHMLGLEHPQQIAKIVADWLEGVQNATS